MPEPSVLGSPRPRWLLLDTIASVALVVIGGALVVTGGVIGGATPPVLIGLGLFTVVLVGLALLAVT